MRLRRCNKSTATKVNIFEVSCKLYSVNFETLQQHYRLLTIKLFRLLKGSH